MKREEVGMKFFILFKIPTFLAILLATWLQCSSQERCSSMVIPRKVADFSHLRFSPFRDTERSTSWNSEFFFLKHTIFVLSTLSLSLFALK